MARTPFQLGLLLLIAAGCTAGASVGAPCSTDDQCALGQYCVNGACSGAVACTSDDACGQGQVCGSAGLCEPAETLPETCQSHADCPLRAYCNTSLPQPTCILLQDGSCRDASQCPGQVCSALPGGVGRCVACVTGDQCASGVCLSDGRCGGSGLDAGTGSDAGSSFDAAGATDPGCGGDGQRCCTSTQPTECDSASLVCLRGFPGASDAYCWRRCAAVACTTLEGGSGWCHLSSTGQGSCQAAQAWTCSSTSQCQQLGASGACVYLDEVNAYCFAMGCDWQADCGSGYYCSTYDGNLCLAVSMLGG